MPSLVMSSPIGRLGLREEGGALTAIHFDADARGEHVGSPLLHEAHRQLTAYFAGDLRIFDLPLRPSGTDFQKRVWHRVERIPFGTTTTYGAIALDLGLPVGAARAVGAANGANPLPIVIACHRVVGADRSLTGYAGGLARKAALLALESPSGTDEPAGLLF